MKKTGEMIKQARESKGLSVHEISLNLKINSKVLKAIEDGDLENLPAKTFLRGFVKSYASYLKMDVEKVLNSFSEEMGTTKPQLPVEEPSPTTETKSHAHAEMPKKSEPIIEAQKREAKFDGPLAQAQPKKASPLTYSIVGVILVILILSAKQVVEKYRKEAKIDQTVTAVNQPVTLPLAASGAVESVATTVVAPGASAATTIAASVSAPSEKTANVETKNINPKPTVAVSDTNTGEIVIQAKKDVAVNLKTAGGESESVVMKPNDVHTFKTSVGVEIMISNAGAVDVFVNGKTAGKLGSDNKPIKLVY